MTKLIFLKLYSVQSCLILKIGKNCGNKSGVFWYLINVGKPFLLITRLLMEYFNKQQEQTMQAQAQMIARSMQNNPK